MTTTKNEIKTYQFESHALTLQQVAGEWWASTDEATEALGYANRRKLLNLYKRHESEFGAGETAVLDLRTNSETAPDAASRVGNFSAVRFFSPRGLQHLAILGRTPACVRFRRWILDVITALSSGDAALVSREQIEALVERRVASAIAAILARLDPLATDHARLADQVKAKLDTAYDLAARGYNNASYLDCIVRGPSGLIERTFENEKLARSAHNRINHRQTQAEKDQRRVDRVLGIYTPPPPLG